MAEYSGLVEGFYWKQENAVLGQHSEFDHEKRIKLLRFMRKKRLNVYLYDPKLLRGGKNYNLERAFNPKLIGDYGKWQETFSYAKCNNINFIWGIAPGSYNPWKDTHPGWRNKQNEIFRVIEKVLSLGATKVALLFDDCAGIHSDNERKNAALLAEKINKLFPDRLFCLCPGVYYGRREHFEKKNKIIDDYLSSNIPLIFTGHHIRSRGILEEDIPRSKKRKMILWDNWISAKQSKPDNKFLMTPPLKRDKNMYKKIHSYLLNGFFPIENIIPVVSAVGLMHRYNGLYMNEESIDTEVLNNMVHDWAEFLQVDETPLKQLMYYKNKLARQKPEKKNCKEIIKKWPSLEVLFQMA